MKKHSFAPVSAPDAEVLILGSLPGEASLALGQYYGHPRNAFWRIMGDLFGAGPDVPYAERLRVLTSAGVALWDVCHSARREGSLDTAIDPGSVVPNRLVELFAAHPLITLVCFNGSRAEALYRRLVLPQLDARRAMRYERLPSTSPAHAGMPYSEKLRRWSIIRSRVRPDASSINLLQ